MMVDRIIDAMPILPSDMPSTVSFVAPAVIAPWLE
jgi:hypothetical protein